MALTHLGVRSLRHIVTVHELRAADTILLHCGNDLLRHLVIQLLLVLLNFVFLIDK